ncbi:hypothetical protein [Chryseobacterium sp. ERMR1:04]|uniref:hypothetical protein n=1 Tax=Chryseobacterium sp. ERMR1:04 TaxID=1705393 RepID=UPI0006C88D36|nr:hypothetical protein [Chryseobacterium sp. ERMR1:04]KPH13385.1 hypothetical protein AMQ68_13160 [Chryseobacterium sp. ERMR1:04]
MKLNFFLTLSICLFFFGCDNKKIQNPNCLAVINTLDLKFNIVDRESKKDLFFTEGAAYQISDLKIYKTSDIKHEQSLKIEVEGEPGRKNFSIKLDGDLITKEGSLDLLIGNAIKHRLNYTVLTEKKPCPEYKFDQIKFDQTVVTSNTGIYMLTN